MKWMKIIVGALCLFAMLGGPSAQAGDSKIKEIKSNGALRICHAEALPMNYKDPKTGNWTGYNIDAGEDLAENMGVKLVHVDSTWATVIPSLLADKCDIGMVGLFRTAARAQVVLFADAWGFDTQQIAVSESSNMKTYAELDQAGKVISVLSGTADEAYARVFFVNAEVKALVSDKLATIFLEVASKRADAVFTDSTTMKMFVEANPAMKLRALGDEPVNPQGYSYAIAPGEYHFQQFVNIWMERTETSGKKKSWHNKWFK